MMRQRTSLSSELLPGTLEVLILKTLTRGPLHGYAIARHLERASADLLQIGESSLYPALQRLLVNEWVHMEQEPARDKSKENPSLKCSFRV